ncbi:hypothetical protein [Streptomyces sp. CB02115]|uniref:hypothetical protein n=1 Tax=Streptomyces sp. CB02115 TaxID=1703939 RepID=UPI0009394E9B|nr:hypothetical protein [Streptomyces sp. CB02115]OKJ50851.1 hypothetical protein AMK28_28520 [Streptomyces sp. CB02115]
MPAIAPPETDQPDVAESDTAEPTAPGNGKQPEGSPSDYVYGSGEDDYVYGSGQDDYVYGAGEDDYVYEGPSAMDLVGALLVM